MIAIPPATADKLTTEFLPGTRHKAAIDIALPLLGNGMPESTVTATLRSKFPKDITDREIQDVVRWCASRKPTPTAYTSRPNGYHPKPAAPVQVKTPLEHADWWTSGATAEIQEIIAKSPTPIPDNPVEASILALSTSYQEQDRLNIVTRYQVENNKARPFGPGKTLPRNDWVKWFKDTGIPMSEAGAWFRINPCAEKGSGKDGAVTDLDVTAFRFVLLESDSLPVEKQAALLLRWKLPIAVMVDSGGVSIHSWVKVECTDANQFKELAERLLEAVKPFGFDGANKNPSRLCRLPGAVRKIGAVNGGLQRVLWIDSECKPLTHDFLRQFEDSLKLPAVLENPLLPIAADSLDRYSYMLANAGKLGVPTGLPKLDAVSGGWKKGQTIVISGATGGGKTTFALHCILAALQAEIGVLLFSLEMDREEIFDLLVSSKCRIDRNKFNTGRFNQHDMAIMADKIGGISKMPLWIEDSAMTSLAQIRLRTSQLIADNKIGLVVVDYIQFVNPDFKGDNREREVAHISHELRAMTRDLKIPMLVLSQLNDQGLLRESRVVSHNANIVLNVKVEGDNVTVTVIKGRGIPYGDYKLTFDRMFATLVPEPYTPEYADVVVRSKPVTNDP